GHDQRHLPQHRRRQGSCHRRRVDVAEAVLSPAAGWNALTPARFCVPSALGSTRSTFTFPPTMELIDGNQIAADIIAELKTQVAALPGRKPCIALVRVGEDPASVS